jgi:stress response protein YsnF
MPPLDIETALDWRGRKVVDRDGDKIGTFDELYLDESDQPAWAAVTTGLFGMRQTFVPLSEARADGDVLQVPFGKEMVKDAPNVDPDTQLDPEEEALLYRHYGLRGDDDDGVDEAPAPAAATDADADADDPGGDDAGAGDDDRGDDDDRGGDDDGVEMIRSEEEVSVGTRRRVSGKARLKKYVVTEHVQKVVPVQREEVRVEFEPAEGEERGER